MKAATIQNKKSFNKGKFKKTIKNVLCRPDALFWPEISEEHGNILEKALAEYKVNIPEFKKSHWKDLKNIPKEERPRPSKIKKVEGFIFGIRECYNALKNKECAAIVVDTAVNPRTIVQPVLDACVVNNVSAVCLNNLKQITSHNFGIPTRCLGIKINFLLELRNNICDIANHNIVPQSFVLDDKTKTNLTKIAEIADVGNENESMDEEEQCLIKPEEESNDEKCLYLYRSSKNSRAFIPPSQNKVSTCIIDLEDQNVIYSTRQEKINNQTTTANQGKPKSYFDILVKRYRNNPNRFSRKTK